MYDCCHDNREAYLQTDGVWFWDQKIFVLPLVSLPSAVNFIFYVSEFYICRRI